MEDENFWFPSKTGGYTTAAGSVRINIHYDKNAANETNIGCELLKLSALDMPFEINPSANTFRFPAITFTFYNQEYDSSNNFFEQYSILNETYKNELFVDVYIDGAIIWQGIVDFAKIKKSDYYIDGSDLKYRKISIKCYDRLAYFWFNPVLDLDDASYADDTLLKTIIQNILAEINISSGNIIFDSNISIDEPHGSSYNIDDFKIRYFSGSELLKDFLKDFMLAFAIWIYSWNGKYYIVHRNGGSTTTVDADDVMTVRKIENANPIEYIKVEDTFNWGIRATSLTLAICDSLTEDKDYGDSDVVSAKQFVIDVSNFLDRVYIEYPGAAGIYPVGLGPATDASPSTLEDDAQGNPPDYISEDIETGHVLVFEEVTTYTSIRVSITDISTFEVTFTDIEKTPGVGGDYEYTIIRNPGATGQEDEIYKIYLLLLLTAAVYNDFFLTSPDIIQTRLRDISTHINLHNKFSLLSQNYRIKGAKIYFDKDELQFDLVKVT